MKIVDPPTIDRRSPLFECENCGKQSTISHLYRRADSDILSCSCDKDHIKLPQNASDYSWSNHEPSLAGRSHTNEHESTCEPIGRGGLGDSISKNIMNKTPTPRTDRAVADSDGQWSFELRYCSRQLETELTAVTEQRDRLAEALNKYRGQIDNEGNHSAPDALQSLNQNVQAMASADAKTSPKETTL